MIRTDLLELLANALDAHEDNGIEFDLIEWKRKVIEDHVCKTTCCAVGIGIERIPEIAALLRFRQSDAELEANMPDPTRWEGGNWDEFTTIELVSPDNDSFFEPINMVAVEFVFGLTKNQSSWLFLPDSYKEDKLNGVKTKPKNVAARIRELIRPHKLS